MADLRNIIRQLAKPDGETVALVCTVDEVYKDTRTIDCSPINEGAPLLGVNLQANQEADYGLCVFPEKGSYVIVGFVAEGAAGVVLATEKIESAQISIGNNSATLTAKGISIDSNQIFFNGGQLGGLVKINELTQKLNALVDVFNAHTHTGSCPTGAVEVTAPEAHAPSFISSDYENTHIKH